MDKQGTIHPLPLLVIATILMVVVAYVNKNPSTRLAPVPIAFAPTSMPSPTFTPTPIPTPVITPTPTQPPAPPAVSGSLGAGLSSINVATEKGDFKAMVLVIDLTNAKMVTDTADDSDCVNDCKTLTLKEFVEKNNGFAGVNGSYFCPDTYPECSSKKNSFDFPVYNSRLNKWINQGNLFWGARAMIYTDGSGSHHLQNAKDFNGEILSGVVNYPGLLMDGNVQIDENHSGLSDKQKIKGMKVGIGVKDNKNVMVVVAYDVTMYEFAYVFKSLGAKGALNLDTGGSTALYYNGSYLAGPGRNIPNAIIFTR